MLLNISEIIRDMLMCLQFNEAKILINVVIITRVCIRWAFKNPSPSALRPKENTHRFRISKLALCYAFIFFSNFHFPISIQWEPITVAKISWNLPTPNKRSMKPSKTPPKEAPNGNRQRRHPSMTWRPSWRP